MSERHMAALVCGALKEARMDPVRVENRVGPGTPDVNYVEGWLELKELDGWPPQGRPVLVPHFRPEQRIWLDRRASRLGRVHLLLKVEQDWLLLPGEAASRLLGRATREELERASEAAWRNTGEMKEGLPRCLSRQRI